MLPFLNDDAVHLFYLCTCRIAFSQCQTWYNPEKPHTIHFQVKTVLAIRLPVVVIIPFFQSKKIPIQEGH